MCYCICSKGHVEHSSVTTWCPQRTEVLHTEVFFNMKSIWKIITKQNVGKLLMQSVCILFFIFRILFIQSVHVRYLSLYLVSFTEFYGSRCCLAISFCDFIFTTKLMSCCTKCFGFVIIYSKLTACMCGRYLYY